MNELIFINCSTCDDEAALRRDAFVDDIKKIGWRIVQDSLGNHVYRCGACLGLRPEKTK